MFVFSFGPLHESVVRHRMESVPVLTVPIQLGTTSQSEQWTKERNDNPMVIRADVPCELSRAHASDGGISPQELRTGLDVTWEGKPAQVTRLIPSQQSVEIQITGRAAPLFINVARLSDAVILPKTFSAVAVADTLASPDASGTKALVRPDGTSRATSAAIVTGWSQNHREVYQEPRRTQELRARYAESVAQAQLNRV